MLAETPPQPTGLYFGWRVVIALVLCTAGLLGVTMSSFIMVSEPMGAALGLSNAETGTLVSAVWLTAPLVVIAAPVLRLLGSWVALIAGMLIEAASLALIYFTHSYEQIFALRLLAGVGLVLVVGAAPVIVAHWFRDRFATAMAIVWSAGAAGQMLLPPAAVALIQLFGWRNTTVALGGILVAITLAALLLSRGARSPADLGLLQDGLRPDQADAATIADHADVKDLSWSQAIRAMAPVTATFMCVAAFCAGATSLAFQAQSPALFGLIGLNASQAAEMISLFYGTALLGSLACGWLLDRFGAAVVSLGVSALVFPPLAALMAEGSSASALLIAVTIGAFGFGIGAGEVLWITLFKRQFGTPAFATTYGIFFFSFQMGMAAGGYIGGRSLEGGGSGTLLITLMLLYIAPAIFSIVRPGGRNNEQHAGPAPVVAGN